MLRLAIGLTLLAQICWALPYYGEGFDLEMREIKSTREIKAKLTTILRGAHTLTAGGHDIIEESCKKSFGRKCYKKRVLDYREARSFLFGELHLQKDIRGYFVKSVYCEEEVRSNNTNGIIGPMKIPDAKGMNCEHTWPQSRFNSRYDKKEQKTDLHHLFPTDSKTNSMRANFQFAEVQKDRKHLRCSNNHLGSAKHLPMGNRVRYQSIYFEPTDHHKGNVARALFYFSIMYGSEIDSVEEYYLRKWHKEDPVDEQERRRNDGIFEIQKNRNPFIDFPELVDKIENF